MERQEILYPLFMMVILTFIVIWRQFFISMYALKQKDISFSFYKLFKDDKEVPDYLEAARMHYRNMFEVPILFYVLVLFLYLSNSVTELDVLLAWLFVIGRIAHSLVRTFQYDNILFRFKCFAFSIVVIMFHWLLVMMK